MPGSVGSRRVCGLQPWGCGVAREAVAEMVGRRGRGPGSQGGRHAQPAACAHSGGRRARTCTHLAVSGEVAISLQTGYNIVLASVLFILI